MTTNDDDDDDDDSLRSQNFCPTLNWGAKPKCWSSIAPPP